MRQTLPLYSAALCFGSCEYQPKLARPWPGEPGATPARHPLSHTENYQTLVLDLHTHSVFRTAMFGPNQSVRSTARRARRWQLPSIWSFSRICRTSPIRMQPAYEEAVRAAEGQPVKIIPGVEITRTGDEGPSMQSLSKTPAPW